VGVVKEAGFVSLAPLLELCLGLGLFTILSAAVLIQAPLQIREKWEVWRCLQWFYVARMKAIATDTDIFITANGSTVSQSTGFLPTSFSVTAPLSLSLNVPKLGFKSTGRTSHSGTLSIMGHSVYAISLGIGNGKPRLR
jgi:hypothetical protein